jgi:hypothetical protein
MQAIELWELLGNRFPDEVDRVTENCGPIVGSALNLLELLDDRYSSARIADERSGFLGNPYEQLRVDFFTLVGAARDITGQNGRPRWERQWL